MISEALQGALGTIRDRSLWRWAAAALTLLALVFLLLQTEQPVTSGDTGTLTGPDRPDSFIVNATYRSFDEQGRLAARIDSVRGEKYADEQRISLRSPQGLLLERDTRSPWLLDASSGEYHMNEKRMVFNNNVHVRHQSRNQGETLLTTRTLTVDNRRRIVHTEAPVTIINRNSLTTAIGMKGWVDERVLELEHQVEGHYFTANKHR